VSNQAERLQTTVSIERQQTEMLLKEYLEAIGFRRVHIVAEGNNLSKKLLFSEDSTVYSIVTLI
jgi:hypothetical protein